MWMIVEEWYVANEGVPERDRWYLKRRFRGFPTRGFAQWCAELYAALTGRTDKSWYRYRIVPY